MPATCGFGKLALHMIDILLNTTFFVLPIAGATLLLIKVLFENIFSWDITRESKATTKSTGIRLIIASIAVVLGVLLCFFATCLLFFPAHQIPEIIKILGIILYFGFWGISGILYRMTEIDKADIAGRKKNGLLNKLFVLTADHMISLNPKLDIRNLLNHQNHQDPPNRNADF